MITDNSIIFTIIILFLLFIAVAYLHYLSTGKDSFEKSMTTIFKAIYNFFKEEPQEASPFNTVGFVESVKNNLCRYSVIKEDYLYRGSCPEPGHHIIEFVGEEGNLNIFMELFKRCIQTALESQGYTPLIYIESEKVSANTWNVHAYFATTTLRQKSLSEWIAHKNALKRENIANTLSSPVDKDLEKDIADVVEKKRLKPMSNILSNIKLGFDLALWELQKTAVLLCAPSNLLHAIIVGGSGSGKSTFLLYFIYNIKKSMPCELTICDFKSSGELKGITPHYAEFEDCIKEIRLFYEAFVRTPEGGNGVNKFLIIDEIAGLLTHLSMTKEGKQTADEIRMIMSSILMLGRSRHCFLILSMQRYTASIFPSASGSADNFGISIGLGNLTVDGRRGLFAGEHFPEEEQLSFGTGRGIILVEGSPLRGLQMPNLDKQKLLHVLQSMD